jgi:hypothetical protein
VHAHHIILRSQGGTDDEWNLISLCAVHHLRGIHGGYIRVSGRAPDELMWQLTRAPLPDWIGSRAVVSIASA